MSSFSSRVASILDLRFGRAVAVGVMTLGASAGMLSLTEGVAFAAPVITLTPIAPSFGSANAGTTGNTVTFKLKVTGGTVHLTNNFLNTLNPLVAGNAGKASYSITGHGCEFITLTSGQHCFDTVTFNPTVSSYGSQVAQLEIDTTAFGPQLDTLRGISIPPGSVSVLSPTTLTLSAPAGGTSSGVHFFSITNPAGSPQNLILGTPYASLPAGSQFALTNVGVSSACTNGEVLAAGMSCNAGVSFNPPGTDAAPSTVLDAVTISDNGVNPQVEGLIGNVTANPTPTIVPSFQYFGSLAAGTGNTLPGSFHHFQNMDVTGGGSVMTGTPFFTTIVSGLGNGGAASFLVSADCANVTVASGSSCPVFVDFDPPIGSYGLQEATLTIPTNHGDATATEEGNSIPPGPISDLSPTSITSFTAAAGGTSTLETFAVTNDTASTQNLTFTSPVVTLTGPFGTTSAGVPTACALATVLGAGQSCNVGILFVPAPGTATGTSLTGTATVNDNGINAEVEALKGSVTAPHQAISDVTPAGLGFVATAGASSGMQYLIVANDASSTAPLNFPSNPVASFSAADFSINNTSAPVGESACVMGLMLAPGATCSIGIQYNSPGGDPVNTVHNATVTIADSGVNVETATLQGTTVAPNEIVSSLSATSLSFKASPGTTSATQVVTVTNPGTGILTVTGLLGTSALFSTNQGSVPFPPCDLMAPGTSLPHGASCNIGLQYSPPASEAPGTTDNATVTIVDNGVNLETVQLTGQTTASNLPESQVSPANLSFTAVAGGTGSAIKYVTVTDTVGTGATLYFHSPVATTASTHGSFVVDTSNGHGGFPACGVSVSLTPGSSCVIGVKMVPGALTAGMTDTGTLTVNDNGSNTETVALSGEVVTPAPANSVITPGTWNFGAVHAGLSSTEKLFNVKNDSSGILFINGGTFATLTGAAPGSFSIDTTVAHACAANETLLPGHSCNVGVLFTPLAGEVSGTTDHATLNIADSGANSLETALLTGKVAAKPISSVTPGSLTFNQPAGTTSAVKFVTVTNASSGSQSLLFTASPPASSSNPVFLVNVSSGNGTFAPCAGTLAVGASCVIGVEYMPTSVTPGHQDTGTLTIADDGQPETVRLVGNVTTNPSVTSSVTPTSHDFGSVIPPAQSAPFTFVVTNTSPAGQNLVLENDPAFAAITGANAGSFSIDSSGLTHTCTASLTLTPGATCNVGVRFTPGIGEISGTVDHAVLEVFDNGMPDPETANLTGTVGSTTTAQSSVSPLTLNFGALKNTISAPQYVTVTNVTPAPGTATLDFSHTPATISDPHFSLFTTSGPVGGPALCTSSTMLSPGQSCTIGVEYMPGPEATGKTNTGTLTVSDNGANPQDQVTLNGVVTGVLSVLNATSTGCPSASVGGNSTCTAVTVSNSASSVANLTFTNPIATSTNTRFSFNSGASTCNTTTTSLAAGVSSCTIVMTFTPKTGDEPSNQTGTVTLGDSGQTETFTISGQVVTGTVTSVLNPSEAQTLTTLIGGSSTVLDVNIANPSASTLNLSFSTTPVGTITGLTDSDDDEDSATDFHVVAPTTGPACSMSSPLEPGTSCNIGITYSELAGDTPGTDTATLTINDNGTNSETLGLTGVAVANVSTTACAPGSTLVTGLVTSAVTKTTGSLCVFDATVENNVTFSGSGSLQVINSDVTGALSSDGAAVVVACGSEINDASTINATGGSVTVGDNATCTQNKFDGGLLIANGGGAVTVDGNVFFGDLDVNANTGGVAINSNSAHANLNCAGNSPTETGAGNTVVGTLSCPGVTRV